MYFALAAIYIVLEIFIITDVIRNRGISGAGKALWILALLFVPVLAWVVYGIWRIRQSRGL